MTLSKGYHLQFAVVIHLFPLRVSDKKYFCFMFLTATFCYMFLLQMGTNYKAALIPQRIRETMHGWGKSARRKRRLRIFTDDATINTETSTVISLEDDDDQHIDTTPKTTSRYAEIELQRPTAANVSISVAHGTSNGVGTALLQPSLSLSLPVAQNFEAENLLRSSSLPIQR